MFVITKLVEGSSGSYLVVMPDRFFVGDDCPLRDKLFPEFEAYVPFQNCGRIFEGVDNGTRFGIIFGRKGTSRQKMQVDIPVVEGIVPVDFVSLEVAKNDLKVEESERDLMGTQSKFTLPFFSSDLDVKILNNWMISREPLSSWQQGRINLGEKKAGKHARVGGPGVFPFRVVKSESRKSSDNETYRGVLRLEFGASINELPEKLAAHYRAAKAICPNVKRNGVRKIISAFESKCLVEHDYNFNDKLNGGSLGWLRSLTYNHLVNTLAGSYHINTSVQNFLGKLEDIPESLDFIATEVQVLKNIGFSTDQSVEIIATILLREYESDFINICYELLDSQFPREFGNVQKEKLLTTYERISNIAELSRRNRSRFSDEQIDQRSAFAGYAVSKLSASGYCGITKLEKSVYLLEATGCIDLQGLYFREAAGPLDKEALYDPRQGIQAVGLANKYFTISKKESRGKNLTSFTPGEKVSFAVDKTRKALTKNGTLAEADRVLGILSIATTEQAEIIATVFAAWNDLLAYGADDSPDSIVKEVRENWSDTKRRFTPERLKSAIQWLRSKKLVPTGKGPRTFKKAS